MMRTSVIVCPSRDDIAVRALDFVVEGLRAGISQRGAAHLALTGGSSATALFRSLSDDPRAQRVDWSRVHVWQGDERFVPIDHPDRNWAGAQRDWLADGPVPERNLHPVPVDAALAAGENQDGAAARYAAEIDATLPRRAGAPSFDVLLLGVGGDGHILSTFPGTVPIREMTIPALGVDAPTHIQPHLPRVTLAPFVLRGALSVVVMVPGAGKASVVADCFISPLQPDRLPTQLAIRPNAVWLLEPESASELA